MTRRPRILEAEWRQYREQALARRCQPSTLSACRAAFYSGASATLAAVVIDDLDADTIESLADELSEFVAEVTA
jgi:hypothetical protein